MAKPRQLKSKGLALAEVVIGGAILLLALIGVLSSYTTLTTAGVLTSDRTIALQDAQLVMEALRTWQYDHPGQGFVLQHPDSPPPSVSWPSWVQSVKGTGARTLEGENVTVNVVAAAGMSNGLQQVTVTVTWNGRSGNPGIILDSFFAPRPVGT